MGFSLGGLQLFSEIKMAAVPIMATIQVVVPALQLHSDCQALFDRRENFLGVIGFPIPAGAREPTVGVVVCATEAELNAFDPSPSTLHSKLLRKYGFSASGRYQGSLIGFGRQSNRFVFRSATCNLNHFATRQLDPKCVSQSTETILTNGLRWLKLALRTPQTSSAAVAFVDSLLTKDITGTLAIKYAPISRLPSGPPRTALQSLDPGVFEIDTKLLIPGLPVVCDAAGGTFLWRLVRLRDGNWIALSFNGAEHWLNFTQIPGTSRVRVRYSTS